MFTNEGKIKCEIVKWIGAAFIVMRALYQSVVVKKGLAELNVEALDLALNVRSCPILWSKALGRDRKTRPQI